MRFFYLLERLERVLDAQTSRRSITIAISIAQIPKQRRHRHLAAHIIRLSAALLPLEQAVQLAVDLGHVRFIMQTGMLQHIVAHA